MSPSTEARYVSLLPSTVSPSPAPVPYGANPHPYCWSPVQGRSPTATVFEVPSVTSVSRTIELQYRTPSPAMGLLLLVPVTPMYDSSWYVVPPLTIVVGREFDGQV